MDQKGKDRSPMETIRIAKEFLLKNGILVIESWGPQQSGLDLYWCRLDIDGTNLGVNGKGASKLYALASGYGELMERLQTLALFRINSNVVAYDPNTYDRYEKVVPGTEGYEAAVEQLASFMPGQDTLKEHAALLRQLSSLKTEDNNIRAVTFQELCGEALLELPYDISEYYYGTNGMAAGNTFDEAVVQALSEILERYVGKRLLNEPLTPPPIPEAVLQKCRGYKALRARIEEVEKTGRYKVHLLDLSLGLGIPAAGVVWVDVTEATYVLKIGVHPVLEIAIERGFSELLQGRNIASMTHLTMASDIYRDKLIPRLNHGLYRDGFAPFPYSFFLDKPSWVPAEDMPAKTDNAMMKEQLLAIIYGLGYRVFCCDYTHSDIASVHLIVPGMSELNALNEQLLFHTVESFRLKKMITQEMNALEQEKAKEILVLLERYERMDEFDSLEMFTKGTSLKRENIYFTTPIVILKFYLYKMLDDFKSALACLDRYSGYLRSKNQKSLFFDCYYTFLGCLVNGYTMEDARSCLDKFYQKHTVDNVLDDHTKHPFANFPVLKCGHDCAQCNIEPICLGKNEQRVYTKLRKGFIQYRVPELI